jgi:hypothetical protein
MSCRGGIVFKENKPLLLCINKICLKREKSNGGGVITAVVDKTQAKKKTSVKLQ